MTKTYTSEFCTNNDGVRHRPPALSTLLSSTHFNAPRSYPFTTLASLALLSFRVGGRPPFGMHHPNTTAGILSRTDSLGLGPQRSRLTGPPPRPQTWTSSPRRPCIPLAATSSQHSHRVVHGPARPTVTPRLRPSASPGSHCRTRPRRLTRLQGHVTPERPGAQARTRTRMTRPTRPTVATRPAISLNQLWTCQSCTLWQVAVHVPAH
jgi:hypothetical protein